MTFDPHTFDTLYNLKTETEVVNRLRKIKKEIKTLQRDYQNIHRLLREQGVKIPTDLSHQVKQ